MVAKFVEANQVDRTYPQLLLNAEQVASLEKTDDGDTTITMVDGRTYVVDESIKTLEARINS